MAEIGHGPGRPSHGYIAGECTDFCDNRDCAAGKVHEVCDADCWHPPTCTCYGCEDAELAHDD